MSARVRPGVIVILDGFGIADAGPGNAVSLARTPRWDTVCKKFPTTELHAAGMYVGLPKSAPGNCEVGHLALGAGRTVDGEWMRAQKKLSGRALEHSSEWRECIHALKEKRGATLHLVGVVSSGLASGPVEHLHSLLHEIKAAGVERVALHAILEARSTSAGGAMVGRRDGLGQVVLWLSELGLGRVETICGSFYAMDRDGHWDRTEKAFRLLTGGDTEWVYTDPLGYVSEMYEKRFSDEWMPPAKARGFKGIQDGDAVLFFDCHKISDSTPQLVSALLSSEFEFFSRKSLPALSGALLLTGNDVSGRSRILFPQEKLSSTLGEVISQYGSQVRVAEAERYAHVTYFFSGGREEVFSGEKRILVPSANPGSVCGEFPEMSAAQITERALDAMQSETPVLTVINFANADRVAHTGNLPATVRAIETVDRCLGAVLDWIEDNRGFAIVTADHGNAEKMFDDEGGPLPCHTASRVPFALVDTIGRAPKLRPGSLADVAPTFLMLQGIAPPEVMTGTSLLVN